MPQTTVHNWLRQNDWLLIIGRDRTTDRLMQF